MRKLLGLIVLAIVAVLAIAQFGPSALLGEETTRQDSTRGLPSTRPNSPGFPPG